MYSQLMSIFLARRTSPSKTQPENNNLQNGRCVCARECVFGNKIPIKRRKNLLPMASTLKTSQKKTEISSNHRMWGGGEKISPIQKRLIKTTHIRPRVNHPPKTYYVYAGSKIYNSFYFLARFI